MARELNQWNENLEDSLRWEPEGKADKAAAPMVLLLRYE